MNNIFENIVTKENDHTNLLRNIMERHPRVAAAVLSYLVNRKVSEIEAASLEFRTQHSFLGPSGREIPDILVEGQNFRCLIEAKVDPALELTDGQKRGYQGCFAGEGEGHLSFLVPNEWKHIFSAEKVREYLPASVSVQTSYWRGLIGRLKDVSLSMSDEILNEAVAFWKWRFEMEEMTPEERESLNTWPDEKYRAIRKLEKTISQVKGLYDARDFETESENSYTESYGFYIKHAEMYLLWIGIWTKSPAPFCFGFHSTKGNWLRPSNPPSEPRMVDGYCLWPLDAETWDDPEKVYEKTKCFLVS